MRWLCVRSPWMRGGLDAAVDQLLGQPVGAVLGAGEHQERALLLFEHDLQQAELAILLDFVDVQIDLFGGLGGGADRRRARDCLTCEFDQVRDGGFAWWRRRTASGAPRAWRLRIA